MPICGRFGGLSGGGNGFRFGVRDGRIPGNRHLGDFTVFDFAKQLVELDRPIEEIDDSHYRHHGHARIHKNPPYRR